MPRKIKRYKNSFLKAKKPLAPQGSSPHPNLQNAIALHQQGNLGQAEALYRQLLGIDPTNADALHLLGVIASQVGQNQSAVDLISLAIEFNSKVASYHSNKGNALKELKQLDAALASYDNAIELKPDYAEACSNRGSVLKELKQLDAALASYDKAIELKPDYAEAFYNRGNALKELKQLDAALASYDKAIELKLGYAEAYYNRGILLKELKQIDAALASYDKAIEFKPDYAEAFFDRGNALNEMILLDAALASYDKAFHLNPDIDYLRGMRQHVRMNICEWSDLSQSLLACESEISRHKPSVTPFIALTFFDKPDVHLLSSIAYMDSKYPKNKALGEIPKRSEGGKIRIGYYSADLYYHPVAIWLAEQIENHDRSKFELFAFSFNPEIKDQMHARLEAAFDHFIAVDKMSDLEVARLSRELVIDIALDLGGYTKNSRTGIFAARAAPIQVSHLGFPGSMGAEYIDYVISDEHSIPECSQKYFTEKIAYVPCVYTYDRQRQVSDEPLSRAEFGLTESGFVFTCQNRCHKLIPEVFGIWMDILKAVPDSVLWLLESNPSAVANLTKEAQARGVERDRLVFTKRETVAADQEMARIGRYLASYRLADLFLDTWPYNAGTTAIDALWAGLPVLTKAGVAAVARMAASALHAIEVPELIVNTAQEYKELAVQLAREPQRLKRIKDKVRENKEKSALFDVTGNTLHIEAAYKKMYERYQTDLKPQHFYSNYFSE